MSENYWHLRENCPGDWVDIGSLATGPLWTCPVCRATAADPEEQPPGVDQYQAPDPPAQQRAPGLGIWPFLGGLLGGVILGLLALAVYSHHSG